MFIEKLLFFCKPWNNSQCITRALKDWVFKIDGEINLVEETDGLEISNVSLPGFPKGILVVQDGFNYDGKKKKSQNYKIISWDEVEKLISVF